MKRTARLAVAALLSLVCAAAITGCVISEEDDYAVTMNGDGKSGTMTTTRYNLQSDQQDPAKQKEDFGELMKTWKGDEYLLSQMKDGLYVKSRELTEKGGKLTWRETSIFADFAAISGNDVVGDSVHVTLGKGESVVATNGRVARSADSTAVWWPVKATSYTLRVRHDDFHPTSDFAAEFKRRPRKQAPPR